MGRKRWISILVVLALAALIAWAWIDGGKRPLEWIEEPLPMPGRAA